MTAVRLSAEANFGRRRQILTFWSVSPDSGVFAMSPTSAAWPTADKAFFFPIVLNYPAVVTEFLWVNGATVNASYNIDVGLWIANDADSSTGTLLCSTGSTAQGTASVVQAAAPSAGNYTIGAGLYWCGMTVDTTSATISRASTAGAITSCQGWKSKTSATIPLSTSYPTITLATNDAAFCPHFGIKIDNMSVY